MKEVRMHFNFINLPRIFFQFVLENQNVDTRGCYVVVPNGMKWDNNNRALLVLL